MVRNYKDGEPCPHRGCKSHISEPCQLCKRTGAKGRTYLFKDWHQFKHDVMIEAKNYPELANKELNEHMLIAYFDTTLSTIEICNDMLAEI